MTASTTLKRTAVVVAVVAIGYAGLRLYNARDFLSASKRAMVAVARQHDPEHISLHRAYNDYVRMVSLPDHTETGIIKLKDGASSKYWFRSHHLTGGTSATLFRMSDGTESYMVGWFCCEVQLPEKQLESLTALKDFIRQHDGEKP